MMKRLICIESKVEKGSFSPIDFPESCSEADIEFLLVGRKNGPFGGRTKRKERDARKYFKPPGE